MIKFFPDLEILALMIHRGLFGHGSASGEDDTGSAALRYSLGKLSSLNLLITNALSGQTKLGDLFPEGLNLSWDETQLLQYVFIGVGGPCGIRIRGTSQTTLSRLTHNNISLSNQQHEAGHYKAKLSTLNLLPHARVGSNTQTKRDRSLPSTHVPFGLYKVPWYRSGKGSTAPHWQLNSSGTLEGEIGGMRSDWPGTYSMYFLVLDDEMLGRKDVMGGIYSICIRRQLAL